MVLKKDNLVLTKRIEEIDFIRGLLLILMTIEHGSVLTRMMGRTGFSPFSMVQFLPTTTTSMFFFLSGFVFGYKKISERNSVQIGYDLSTYNQVWRLYSANAATFLMVTLLISHANEGLLLASRFDNFVQNPLSTTVAFATLISAPFGFDVLQFYMIAFIFAPLYLVVIKVSRSLALALTVGAWLYAQINFLLHPDAYRGIFFVDIVAWQITFAGGMLFGSIKNARGLVVAIQHSKHVPYICAAILITVSPLWIAQRFLNRTTYDELKFSLPGVERVTLGPIRIACAVSILLLLLILTKKYIRPESRPSIMVSSVGRNSLACFCASNILIYIVALIWQETHSAFYFWCSEILMVPAVMLWGEISRFISKQKPNARSVPT